MKKRVRQADVARAAGVSPATVSWVINNRSGGNVRISEETRRRVLTAVEELGYVVDPAARSLAGGRNYLLGVFTFEPIFPLLHRDFYYEFLVGIEEEAEQLGYDLLLFTSAVKRDGVRGIYTGGVNRLRMADGAVLLGVAEDREDLGRLVAEGYPFVFVGRREVKGRAISYVAADYAAATAEVVVHFLASGHRSIAYLGMRPGNESQADRRAGYRRAHADVGLDVDPQLLRMFSTPDELTPGLVQQLCERGATGFVLETGPLGPAFVQAMAELQLGPPHDFSVAVLGDPMREGEIYPGVTSFTIPRRAMGAGAVRILADMLNAGDDAKPCQMTLPCTFVPGRTIGER